MEIQTVKIAIEQPGDSVAVMDLAVVGRGSILPVHAEWIDEAAGWWRREPTDTVIREQISRGQQSYLGPTSGYRIIDASEVPQDRTFRAAWKHRTGKIEVDMPRARQVHLDRIRVARAPILDQLDRDWMKATGQGKKADADAVETKRQKLRDLTTAVDVEAAQTPEGLKAIWPSELGASE